MSEKKCPYCWLADVQQAAPNERGEEVWHCPRCGWSTEDVDIVDRVKFVDEEEGAE